MCDAFGRVGRRLRPGFSTCLRPLLQTPPPLFFLCYFTVSQMRNVVHLLSGARGKGLQICKPLGRFKVSNFLETLKPSRSKRPKAEAAASTRLTPPPRRATLRRLNDSPPRRPAVWPDSTWGILARRIRGARRHGGKIEMDGTAPL